MGHCCSGLSSYASNGSSSRWRSDNGNRYGSSSIHRPQLSCFSFDPPPQLILRRFWEVGRQVLGLLQQEGSLLVGVQPVGNGSGQVKDASPASQRPIQ